MTQVNIKRVYDEPSEQDGYRVLVDRLWPRGMKREYLKYDYWAKEVTPSNDLRKWFHADIEKRWGTFADMYQKELNESDAAKAFIDKIKAYSKVTLLFERTGAKSCQCIETLFRHTFVVFVQKTSIFAANYGSHF